MLQKLKEQIYSAKNQSLYVDLLICRENQLYPQREHLLEYGLSIEEACLSVKGVTYRAVEYINRHYDENINLKHLSEHLFINQTYLSELFKKETKIPFALYVMLTRIEHARLLIQNNPFLKVYEISRMVGIEDPKYFSQIFRKYLGMKPSEYREHLD